MIEWLMTPKQASVFFDLETPAQNVKITNIEVPQALPKYKIPIVTPPMTHEEVLGCLHQMAKVLEVNPGAPLNLYVAGSAAIAPETADDIDFWCLQKGWLQALTNYEVVGKKAPLLLDPPEATKTLKEYLKKSAKGNFCCVASGHIAAGEGGWWRKFQYFHMTSPLSIEDLLDKFDVSCHAWAMGLDGKLICHPQATVPFLDQTQLLPGAYDEEGHKLDASIQRRLDFIDRYGR